MIDFTDMSFSEFLQRVYFSEGGKEGFIHISMTDALSANPFCRQCPCESILKAFVLRNTLSLSSQLKLSHFIRAGLHSRRSTKVESIYRWLPSQVASLPPQIIAQRIFHQNHLQIVEEFPAEGRKMHEPVTSDVTAQALSAGALFRTLTRP